MTLTSPPSFSRIPGIVGMRVGMTTLVVVLNQDMMPAVRPIMGAAVFSVIRLERPATMRSMPPVRTTTFMRMDTPQMRRMVF